MVSSLDFLDTSNCLLAKDQNNGTHMQKTCGPKCHQTFNTFEPANGKNATWDTLFRIHSVKNIITKNDYHIYCFANILPNEIVSKMVLILVSRRSFYFGLSATAEKDSLYSINQRGFFAKGGIYWFNGETYTSWKCIRNINWSLIKWQELILW